MPVKKLRVSFDIDMEVLVKALAFGHSNMDIQAYGAEAAEPIPEVARITNKRSGLKEVILQSLLKSGKLKLHDLRVLIVEAGYSPKSLNSVIHVMQIDGYIRRAGYATFALTKKGEHHVGS
jgi:hypothetical protein